MTPRRSGPASQCIECSLPLGSVPRSAASTRANLATLARYTIGRYNVTSVTPTLLGRGKEKTG